MGQKKISPDDKFVAVLRQVNGSVSARVFMGDGAEDSALTFARETMAADDVTFILAPKLALEVKTEIYATEINHGKSK